MLKELLVKIKSKESIQKKLNDLYSQKDELNIKIKEQRKILRKENEDVEKLEYMNISSFFYYLTRTKENKLSKEKEEAYQAKLKYDSFILQFNTIQKDILYYESKLKEINECEIQYHELYESKLNDIKTTNPNIEQLENDYISSQNKIKELNEAIHVGEIALKTANKISIKLDKAKSWSTYDLIGGGGIGDLVKHGHLDDAQNLINELQAQLNRFKCELYDVKVEFNVKIEIDQFLKFADYWFDSIFADYSVLDRIKNAINQINTTQTSITNVLNHLKKLHLNEIENEKQLKEKLDKIVLES